MADAAKTMTSKLWDMANKLRGTMDASEYKNYILPFIFYRYLSENQERVVAENHLEQFEDNKAWADEVVRKIGYVIDPDYTWEKLVKKITGHHISAGDLQDALNKFNENASKRPSGLEGQSFANIFNDVRLNDPRLGTDTNARAQALNAIILMINKFEFKDDSGHDVLGDVYEYLIGQFAANAGKKGGEFYTPHEVSKVLSRLIITNIQNLVASGNQLKVYDPTMGSGSLLLTVQKELPGDAQANHNKVSFCGQELNNTTYNLAIMNLTMHGVNYKNMDLRCADTLKDDWPLDAQHPEQPQRFDTIVANPPYSQNWNSKDRDDDRRFLGFGVAPASKADYAFVLHGLYHLDPSGAMAIVLPHGVLFRGASEGKIRKNIIDHNYLDAVIGLPANLFYGTSIPTAILVFKGLQARDRRDVLFIDASREFEKGKNQNKLSDANIEKIIHTYHARENVEKYAHVATLEEIQANDYNLNIPRYVDTFEEEPVTPLPEIAKSLAQVNTEISAANDELMSMLRELEGTDAEMQAELSEFMRLMGAM